MSLRDGQPTITVNGTESLEEHLRKQEEVEVLKQEATVRRDIMEASFSGVKGMKSIIYHKPRPRSTLTTAMIKKLSSKVKEFTVADQIRHLLEQSGEKGSVERFNGIKSMKQRQLERLILFNRQITKPSFLLAETVRQFKGQGAGDPSRDLILLQQAGVLKRSELDNGQVEYKKLITDEKQVALALVKNSNKLVGYIPPSRQKQAAPSAEKQVRRAAGKSVVPQRTVRHEPYKDNYTGLFTGMEDAFENFKKIFPYAGTLERFTEIFIADRTAAARNGG